MFDDLLERLGLSPLNSGVYAAGWADSPSGGELVSFNPASEESLAAVRCASREDYEGVIAAAEQTFRSWRLVPPPQRGEVVRQLGLAFRQHKADLGLLISLEVGKIRAEGEGEV